MISVIQELKIWSPKERKHMRTLGRIMKTGGIDKDPRNKRIATEAAGRKLSNKGVNHGAGTLIIRGQKQARAELKKKYRSASLK